MERLNMKLVSVLLLLAVVGPADVLADVGSLLQEQIECTDGKYPNVNFGGRGAGNMYISAAYGTTQADVPICDFWRAANNIFANVFPDMLPLIGPGPGQAVDWMFTYPLSSEDDIVIVDFHYDSGKADGTFCARQTVLAYGWTTNYNLYLIDRSPDIFMADGKGRMTRFQDNGLGGYLPSDGQTHTLVSGGPDIFILEEVDGSSMIFQLALPAPVWADGDKIYLLVGIQDARGRATVLSYNVPNSLLETITDHYGREVQLGCSDYSGKKLLQTITDTNMQVTDVNYINDGNDLWQITDPEGNTLTYGYDSNDRKVRHNENL